MTDVTQRLARKVPHVIAIFWVVKILTTAMGEAVSDFLVKAIDPVIAVALGALGLLIALALQLRAQKYIAWIYWLAVAMVAVFGTMAADVTHVKFGVPYTASTAFFLIALIIVFAVWRSVEGTLSIHSVYTRRREFFYWATVLATFALGTAAGDWTALTLHLGYLVSGIVFAVIIAIPAVAYVGFQVNEVTMFWFAYIITRPLGASFADWIGKPLSIGGLGVGDGVVGLVLIGLIVVFVAYLQTTKIDVESNGTAANVPHK